MLFRCTIIHPLASQWTFPTDRIPFHHHHPLHPTQTETRLSSACQLLDVFSLQLGFLSRLEPRCERDSFGQEGCREVGIKRGSGSTVGQPTAALSGLSISLTTPPRLCFLSLCLVRGVFFSVFFPVVGSITSADNLVLCV